MLVKPRNEIRKEGGEYTGQGTAPFVPNTKVLAAIKDLQAALPKGVDPQMLANITRNHAQVLALLNALSNPKREGEWLAEVVSRDKYGRVQQVKFSPK